VADEIEPKLSPGGYPPAVGLCQVWERVPPVLRLVIPITLLLAAAIAGCYAWMKPSRDDRSRLPSRLVCQVRSGPTPPSPGDAVTYSLANNGTTFAVLTPQEGTDDLAIRNAKKSGGANVRTDKETHAARTAPDTVEISLDLTKFGITKALVSPGLTVSPQPNSPAAGYAAQVCHG
jgi:hypothetical protein